MNLDDVQQRDEVRVVRRQPRRTLSPSFVRFSRKPREIEPFAYPALTPEIFWKGEKRLNH